jgi:molecular chaperone DnaK
LLKLDSLEKASEWPTVSEGLRASFRDFEALIAMMKQYGKDKEYDMVKIEALLAGFRLKVEHALKEKNIRNAKTLTEDIQIKDFRLRNEITDGGMWKNQIDSINANFHAFKWKDANKARSLINEGLNLGREGNNEAARQVLLQLTDLMVGDSLEEYLGK